MCIVGIWVFCFFETLWCYHSWSGLHWKKRSQISMGLTRLNTGHTRLIHFTLECTKLASGGACFRILFIAHSFLKSCEKHCAGQALKTLNPTLPIMQLDNAVLQTVPSRPPPTLSNSKAQVCKAHCSPSSSRDCFHRLGSLTTLTCKIRNCKWMNHNNHLILSVCSLQSTDISLVIFACLEDILALV